MIEKYELLSQNGIIVAESDTLDKIVFSDKFEIVKSRKYGDKVVAILRHL